ncbi:MAG: thiamine phosphate synthase [Alcanivorax sp.]|nr:thiamine phosphate synthase [Alcanivorax sp.]
MADRTAAQSAIHGLYGITDPLLTPGDALLSACSAALSAGLRLLQYRNKTADAATRLQQAQMLQALCQRHGATLLINDDAALAARCGAAGVHIGQQDGAIADARARLGPQAIIGVTCHGDLALARAAVAEGADYVAFGRFFASQTKPDAPGADLQVLRQARQSLPVPVVAIGGVNPDNATQLIDAGAHAVAAIHSLFGHSPYDRSSPDTRAIAATVQQFNLLFPGPARPL